MQSDEPFSVQNNRRCVMSKYVISGGVNLDYLIKVVAARCLYHYYFTLCNQSVSWGEMP